MSLWRRVTRGARALMNPSAADQEIADEVRHYLDQATEELIRHGCSPEDAQRIVRLEMGTVALVKERVRASGWEHVVDTLVADVRYAVRTLAKNPGFAAAAILSLALGVGANAAIFELIDAVRLQTLPVANPQDIALVRLKDPAGTRGFTPSLYPAVTNPIWERIRDAGMPQVDLFAWASWQFDLSENGRSRFTDAGLWVSGSYFPVLGVQPVIGRLFDTTDDHRGCAPKAVISDAFWQREFGGDPSVVGRPLLIDRRPVEILGVAKAGFPGLEVGRAFDVALPICAQAAPGASWLDRGTFWWLTVMARLKPGHSIASAAAQLTAISPGIFEIAPPDYPPESVSRYKTYTLVAESAAHGVSHLREQYADSLWILLAIAGAVLLIASANLANLLLARAIARHREIAIRLAIGASRGRIVRQFLAESALLAAIGGVLGVAIAGSLGRALIALVGTDDATVVLDLSLNWRVFAFTAATAAACAILFGLAPAVRSTLVAAGEALTPGSRGLTADRHRSVLRRALVVCQLALSLALVVCAVQFVTTFRTLATLDPGFQQDGIVEAQVNFRRLGLGTPSDRRAQFEIDVLDRVRAVQGVQSAADTLLLPVWGFGFSNAVWLDGAARDRDQTSNYNVVSDGYLSTLGIPLRAGRDFDPRIDLPASPRVAIVNESFGRRFLKAGNLVGQSFWVERTPSLPQTRYEVIGVVNDTKYQQLRDDASPIFYLSSRQITTLPRYGTGVLVRSDRPASEVITSIERALDSFAPDLVVSFQVLQTRIRQSLRREELIATLSTCFGALAALLATIGLYGVLSYTVARRRNEIGIRMALGADRPDVIALIGREACALVSVGIALGAGLAVAASSVARSLLFGITPGDPASLLLASAGFAFVSALATAAPAVNASRLDPTVAIREE